MAPAFKRSYFEGDEHATLRSPADDSSARAIVLKYFDALAHEDIEALGELCVNGSRLSVDNSSPVPLVSRWRTRFRREDYGALLTTHVVRVEDVWTHRGHQVGKLVPAADVGNSGNAIAFRLKLDLSSSTVRGLLPRWVIIVLVPGDDHYEIAWVREHRDETPLH